MTPLAGTRGSRKGREATGFNEEKRGGRGTVGRKGANEIMGRGKEGK